MSGGRRTNGDEQCRCRLAPFSPHRKKKCTLFGRNGIFVPPDNQIQHAQALDKEVDEKEDDQSPEAVSARIEKAVTDAAGPGVNVKVTVTIEMPPQPPTPPQNGDAGTSTDADATSPPPVPATDSDASVGMAGLKLDGGTQYDEHDTYANSPLADAGDDLLGGLGFERSVPVGGKDNDDSDEDDVEDIVYEEARRADTVTYNVADNDATDSILGGFDFETTVPADDEEEVEHDTVVQI